LAAADQKDEVQKSFFVFDTDRIMSAILLSFQIRPQNLLLWDIQGVQGRLYRHCVLCLFDATQHIDELKN